MTEVRPSPQLPGEDTLQLKMIDGRWCYKNHSNQTCSILANFVLIRHEVTTALLNIIYCIPFTKSDERFR